MSRCDNTNLNAASDSDHRWLSVHRGDSDCAHLVLQAIVLTIIDDEVKDISYRLVSGFK